MDQIHPNAKGQGILADAVYAVLDSTGGLTGMPVTPTAHDGGVASTAPTDAGGTTGATAATSAADGGAGKPSAGGAADGGVSGDAGRSTGTKPVADSGTSAGRALDSGTPTDNASADDDDDEAADSDGPSSSEPARRGDSGCQAIGGTAGSQAAASWLLLLLGLALRTRPLRTRKGAA